jgi:E3 ubiquitin-protein ligase makorin
MAEGNEKTNTSGRSRSHSSVSSDQVCRFFVRNKCLRGDSCPYSHDLTVDESLRDEEGRNEQQIDSPTSSCVCAICLQSVLAEGRRFGLLPLCNHLFCLDCILAWRHRSSVSRESARRCPMCRVPSYFVIPSNRFFTGDPKRRRVQEYLEFLAQKPCMYYSESAETELCPYGCVCFFHHRNSPNLDTMETKIRLVYTKNNQEGFCPSIASSS